MDQDSSSRWGSITSPAKARRRGILLLFLLPMVLVSMLGGLVATWSLYSLREENRDRHRHEREDLRLLIDSSQLGEEMAVVHQLVAHSLQGAAAGELDEAALYLLHSEIVEMLAALEVRTRDLSQQPHVLEAGDDNVRLMVEDFDNYRNFVVMATDIAAIDPLTATGYIDKAHKHFVDFVQRRQTISARISDAALAHVDQGALSLAETIALVLVISGVVCVLMLSLAVASGRFLSLRLTAIADALNLMAVQTGVPPPLPEMETMQRRGFGEFKEMAAAVLAFRTAIEERQQAEEKSITDELTGLRNRRFLMTRFREEFERTRRDGSVLGFLMIDLDHFKNINDTCGHPFGDLVLQRVAGAIQGMLREYDVAGRYGGEEFAVVATGGPNSDLLALAERIRQAIEELEIREGSVSVRVTISVGLAVSAVADTQETLLKRADTALYQAKEDGRNRTVLL